MKVTTHAEINVEGLSYELCYYDALAMMKQIDKGQVDLEFTFEIAAYLIRDIIANDDPNGDYVQALKDILENK